MMMDDLLKDLRARDYLGGFNNPDGPKAADWIEELISENHKMRAFLVEISQMRRCEQLMCQPPVCVKAAAARRLMEEIGNPTQKPPPRRMAAKSQGRNAPRGFGSRSPG